MKMMAMTSWKTSIAQLSMNGSGISSDKRTLFHRYGRSWLTCLQFMLCLSHHLCWCSVIAQGIWRTLSSLSIFAFLLISSLTFSNWRKLKKSKILEYIEWTTSHRFSYLIVLQPFRDLSLWNQVSTTSISSNFSDLSTGTDSLIKSISSLKAS